jgi:hypothetical protein
MQSVLVQLSLVPFEHLAEESAEAGLMMSQADATTRLGSAAAAACLAPNKEEYIAIRSISGSYPPTTPSPACGVGVVTKVHTVEERAMSVGAVRRSRKATLPAAGSLLLALLLWQPAPANARWATPGGDIHNTNAGNVGVGTVKPQSRLHVEGGAALGSVRVSGAGLAVMNFKDTAAAANQKLYQWRSEGGSFRMTLIHDDESSYARQNILVANSSGHVGVGTASPSTALEVGGGGTLSLSRSFNFSVEFEGQNRLANTKNPADKTEDLPEVEERKQLS